MDMNIVLATVTLFGVVSVTNINSELLPEWMQYGSFGLVCMLVLYLIYQINELGKIIRQKDKEYVELLKSEIKSRNDLTNALKDRPCVAGDHRIKQFIS